LTCAKSDLAAIVFDLLNQGETPLTIAIAFDGSGNVREAHVVKSSGVPAADEVVRVWIEV
jgi:hypothetical protein